MVVAVQRPKSPMEGAVLASALKPLLVRALVGFCEVVVIASMRAVTVVAIVIIIVRERRGKSAQEHNCSR